MTRIRRRQLRISNLRVHYLSSGRGPPTVLIHGLGGSCRDWLLNIRALSNHFLVLAPDLVGFGRSDKPRSFPSDPVTSFFPSLLNHFSTRLGLGSVNIVGHSMGGLVALQFALQFPRMVNKLVLVDSAGLGKEVPTLLRLLSIPALPASLLSPPKTLLKMVLSDTFHNEEIDIDESIEEVYNYLRSEGAKESFLAVTRSIVGLRGQKIVLSDQLKDITAKTLIIWGDQDKSLPVSHAHRAHRLIIDSELHILPQCGHCPQIEKPNEFNTLVTPFLSRDWNPWKNRSTCLCLQEGTSGQNRIFPLNKQSIGRRLSQLETVFETLTCSVSNCISEHEKHLRQMCKNEIVSPLFRLETGLSLAN